MHSEGVEEAGLKPSSSVQEKLTERLENPHVPSAALSGMPNCYKIKLREAGFRLIYKVVEDILFVPSLLLGKERS
jgi:mRNA interferase RelE/StbE